MTVIQKLKTTKHKVINLLEKIPHLRDSDDKLVATYLFKELGKDRVELMTAMNVLQMLADGKLTSVSSILRARRKVQEQRLDLRGKSYSSRQESCLEVKKNISEL